MGKGSRATRGEENDRPGRQPSQTLFLLRPRPMAWAGMAAHLRCWLRGDPDLNAAAYCYPGLAPGAECGART